MPDNETGFIVASDDEVEEASKEWAVVLDDASIAAIAAARERAAAAAREHGIESTEATAARDEMDRVATDANTARINDLPFKVTGDIAKRHGLIWAMVGEVPTGLASTDPMAALELVQAAAKHAGTELAVPESHGALLQFFADRFVQVDGDLPASYRDGLPLTGAQTTT